MDWGTECTAVKLLDYIKPTAAQSCLEVNYSQLNRELPARQ